MDLFRSYYIALSSEEAKRQTTENSSSNFVTVLKTPIILKPNVFEVGVAEIFFQPTKNLFGYELDDNKVIVELEGRQFATLTYKKQFPHVAQDVTYFNQNNKEHNIPFQIQQVHISQNVRYQIVQKYGNQVTVHLHNDFAHVFGFEKQDYVGETITAELPFNEVTYNALPNDYHMLIDLILHPAKRYTVVPEPHEQTLEGLVTSLNTAFVRQQIAGLNFVFQFEEGKEEIKLEGNNERALVLPSKRICEIFDIDYAKGIKTGFVSSNVDLYRRNHRIILTSNISSSQVLFDSAECMLRIFPHPRDKEKAALFFNPIMYSPISNANIDSVHLKIINESMDYIPFKGDVTVVLHIRPRSI